jgi:hypothetical protein
MYPPDVAPFDADTAWIRSRSASPLLRSCAGSASTWYSFWNPPKLTTSATPAVRIRCLDTTQSCQLRSSLGVWRSLSSVYW